MEKSTSALPPSYAEAVQENSIKQDKTDVENNKSSSIPQQPLPTAPDNVPSYGSISYIPTPTEIFIRTGEPCPACVFGDLEPDYPCLGWACAICCFPIGIIFCLLMKQKKCSRCDAEF